MMLPVSRFKGQPVTMVTTTPWFPISRGPVPRWFGLAGCSASAYQAVPPLVFYPPAVWIPEHLVQWEHPAVEVFPPLRLFHQSSSLPLHPLPEETRDKRVQKAGGNPPRRHLLLIPSQLSGGAYWELSRLPAQRYEEVGPFVLSNPRQREKSWVKPKISHKRRPPPLIQAVREIESSFVSSKISSRLTLMTNFRDKQQGLSRTVLLKTERTSIDTQSDGVSTRRESEEEEEGSETGQKDNRPVASTPVPGSPWCVVWTADDRVFFFNPTMHLSVWETPGELIGHNISDIIKNPPHKTKKRTHFDISSTCQSSRLHGDDEEDQRNPKRKRTEDAMSLVPRPGDIKLLPLGRRIARFREMMLERGVSAFSTWEKELHKMVFDPRYLLLTSDHRKQVFDEFVKSRMKDEYKEKRSKLQKAREEFKRLLEEAKITGRTTFKEFCGRYHGDQRFRALSRKTEQEVLFQLYITSLKKQEKKNRERRTR